MFREQIKQFVPPYKMEKMDKWEARFENNFLYVQNHMQQKRFKEVMKVNGVAKDVKLLPVSGVEEQQQLERVVRG